MKIVYFFARKRFAIGENFEDVINYLTELGGMTYRSTYTRAAVEQHTF